MKSSPQIALLLILGMMLGSTDGHRAVETAESPDHIGPGTTNPIERMEYLKMLAGDGPDGGKRTSAIIRVTKELRSKKKVLQRDAGIQEWEELGPDNEGGRVRAIAINPFNTNQIFIGGVGGGIWKSTNGGSSWSVATRSTLAYPVTSIVFDPTDGNIIYATTGEFIAGGGMNIPGVGLLKSTDNGNSWIEFPIAPGFDYWLAKVIVNPEDPNILFVCGSLAPAALNVASGRVYRSNDAGLTWQGTSVTSTTHVFDIDINPADTSVLYIGTGNDVLKSTDSGASFVSMSGGTPASPITTLTGGFPSRCDVSLCTSDPDNVYVLRYLPQDIDTDPQSDTLHSEVWFTGDAGDNWTLLSRTTSDDSADDEEICILGSQGTYDNIVWADPDDCTRAVFGGINLWKWESGMLTRISDDDDDIGGADDGGGNNSIHADQHMIMPHPDYGPSNKSVFVGNDGGVYKTNSIWTATTNSGWESLVDGHAITQLYAVDVSLSGDTVYGGSQDNSFFVNRDMNSGGLDWVVTVRADGGPGAIKKSNPEIIYGSIQGGISYKSTNGGDSYSVMFDLSNTTNGNDSALFIAPFEMDPNDDQVLYTAGKSLWRSTDEGANWAVNSATFVGKRISTIEIAKGNGNRRWIGLTDGYLYETLNGGGQWTQRNILATMPRRIVTDVAVNPNNHAEVMVTFGGGYDTDVIWFDDDGPWQNRSLPFPMQVYCVVWHPENANWVYVGTDLGIFASEDKGQNWTATPLISGHPGGNNSDGPVFTPVTDLVWQGDGSDTHPYYLVAATHGRGIWRTIAPIRLKYYVDKSCNPCGLGSFTQPFQDFDEAVAAAGSGSEIIFLSGGTYETAPPDLLISKRIKVTIDGASSPVVIE